MTDDPQPNPGLHNGLAPPEEGVPSRPAGNLSQPEPLPAGMLSRFPWLTFVLPLAVYMIVGEFEPRPPATDATGPDSRWGLAISYDHYPLYYAVRLAATCVAVALVLPGYRTFRLRVSPGAVVLGLVGAVAWIALAQWRPEAALLNVLGLDWLTDMGQRSAFNPYERFAANPGWAYAFLAMRFAGLVLVVPLVEELFLRGFVMRFVVAEKWWQVPVGQVNTAALVAGTLVPMLMHPGELVAALVWFSAVTWWMVRTGRIWDCVLAHAVTNLALGIYVVSTGAWELM